MKRQAATLRARSLTACSTPLKQQTTTTKKGPLTLFERWPSTKSRTPAGRADTNVNYDREGKETCMCANKLSINDSHKRQETNGEIVSTKTIKASESTELLLFLRQRGRERGLQ